MKDKTILITGGTTGIGFTTAQLLLAAGAKVIITGRNPKTLDAARTALPEAIVLQSDAADLDAALALGQEVRKHASGLDGAFLNAGTVTFAPIADVTPKNYDDMFNVNVRGLYFQLQSLLPLLKNPSSVVFNSSIAATVAMPGTSIYSATKAAVSSFGRVLAVELAPQGIRVNVISPGPIDTPILKKAGLEEEVNKGLDGAVLSKLLPKRLGRPEECAHTVRFLLSEESGNIYGEEINIDGGFRLS